MKRFKRLLACRNKGGFTLAEMIISCALLGILMLGIVMFVSPILDTVTSTNASTKASNVAESIEYYISRSLRNASYVAVLTDTTFADVTTRGNSVITDLKSKADGTTYTLKCISIRYAMDDKSQTYKYFICNENVESSGALTGNNPPQASTMVFDSCYFDGIYPEVNFAPVQQTLGDATKKDMPAIQIEVNIYDDPQMRKDGGGGYSGLVFSGTGYTILRNIELAVNQENKELSTMFMGINSLLEPTDTDTYKDSAKDTYIFYVERTLAVTTTP